jgi:diguanylate cyclase (GGDEF)-like protein
MSIETRQDTDWSILACYAAAAYLAGAVTNALALAFLPSDHHNWALLPLIAAGVVLAAALAIGRHLPGAAIRALSISGAIILISWGTWVARPMGVAPVWYVLPGLAIARFCARRETIANLVLLCATFALALALADNPQVPALTFASIVLIVVLLVGAHQRQVAITGLVISKLEVAAAIDPLTGLLNRGALNAAFAREVERAQSSQLPLSVVLFDLDHFKQINDTSGHDAGDEALRSFAQILEAQRGPADLVARMGGEEFLAVLFDTDTAAARQFAGRVSQELAGSADFTTSAGVAELGDRLQNPFQLLTAADRALYAAKEGGRDRIVVADGSIIRSIRHVA